MKQEAELIYHRVGESPWPSSRAQPCCKDRLCWRLTQIQEPKMLKAPGWCWKDLKPCEYWHVGIFVRYQHSRRPSFWGAQVSLSSTNREVWFSSTLGPQHLWCDASGHAAPGEDTGLQTLVCIQGENCSPGLTTVVSLSLHKHPNCSKHRAWIPSSPVPRDTGAEMLWHRERRGWPSSTTSTLQFLRASRPSPHWAFSQDAFRAQFLQDIFLLAENRAHTKLNEAKAYHLYTLQKRHHHHCPVKTWKPSRRQNNLCSPSHCSKSTALSWQQKWIW